MNIPGFEPQALFGRSTRGSRPGGRKIPEAEDFGANMAHIRQSWPYSGLRWQPGGLKMPERSERDASSDASSFITCIADHSLVDSFSSPRRNETLNTQSQLVTSGIPVGNP